MYHRGAGGKPLSGGNPHSLVFFGFFFHPFYVYLYIAFVCTNVLCTYEFTPQKFISGGTCKSTTHEASPAKWRTLDGVPPKQNYSWPDPNDSLPAAERECSLWPLENPWKTLENSCQTLANLWKICGKLSRNLEKFENPSLYTQYCSKAGSKHYEKLKAIRFLCERTGLQRQLQLKDTHPWRWRFFAFLPTLVNCRSIGLLPMHPHLITILQI